MSFDTSDLDAFAADLASMSGPTHRAVHGVFEGAAADLKAEWRKNATATAGEHGRLYPYSIDYEQRIGTRIDFEVGPRTDKPQGDMGPGFEFGSVNQPPHLDGQLAADRVIPHLERRVAIAAEDVFDA